MVLLVENVGCSELTECPVLLFPLFEILGVGIILTEEEDVI